MTRYTVRLDHDESAEDPSVWDVWKLVPFNPRYYGHVSPYDYIASVDQFGDPQPANIGVRRKLQAGTLFFVSKYEHSGIVYSLLGEGYQCQWDTTRFAGVLVALSARDLPKGFEAREADARRFLETYNAWLGGEVYGYLIEDETGEFVDLCFGFYEPEYMMQEIAEVVGDHPVEFAGPCAFLSDYYKLAKEAA